MGSQHQVLQPESCCQPASTNQSRSGLQNLSFWVRKRGRTKPCSLGKASIPGIQRDSSPRGAAGKEHPLGMPAGQGQGLGTVQASAHLLLVGRGGPQLPPGPPPMRPYELCLQTLQPPPCPGSPTPPSRSSPQPTAPTPLPRGEPWAPRGGGGGALSCRVFTPGGSWGHSRDVFLGGDAAAETQVGLWAGVLASWPIPQWAGGCRSTAPAFEGGGKQPRSSSLASSPPMSARSALVPTAVLLSLLAVAGSARLVYALWRRREGKGTQGCHCAHPGHSGTHLGS